MAAGDVFDVIEFLDYFVRPWRFIASPPYRAACLETWRTAGVGKRLLLALEVCVSLACGAVPFLVIWLLVAE